jgi:DNA replication and repair protein RecF
VNIASKFVVFYGANGAGKTNILEAISLFSSDRGLRKAPIADLNHIKAKDSSWHLELVHQKDGYKTFLSTAIKNEKRVAKIDDSPIGKLHQLEEFLWMSWLVPSMDNIFLGSTGDRRSFFDHLVSSHDEKHRSTLNKLNRLQKERLHLIYHRRDENWLKILEEKMAEYNVEITKSRTMFIKKLQEVFQKHVSDFLRPAVSIDGEVENICEIHSEEDAMLEIAAKLKNCRNEDCERQTTAIGVQRSRWIAQHPKSMLAADNCSTGEQKAFLISLILASARIMQQKGSAGTPILLLDDLMVHLDKKRRSSLIDEILCIDVQTFFTGTDAIFFEDLYGKSLMYYVEKSICTPVNHPRCSGTNADNLQPQKNEPPSANLI